ncbi:MAG: hypothetical protein IIY81_00070 [Lachnospiraceae bacterium]|nr:hypothetical protein [Lachnospiraceae bacterium]
MASIDGIIKGINERMERTRFALGTGSYLYQFYQKNIMAIMGDLQGFVNIGDSGRLTISRSKKALQAMDQTKLEMIKNLMNTRTLNKEVKQLKKDIKTREKATGKKVENIKEEIKKQAINKYTTQDKFQQLIDFMYDNLNEEESIHGRKVYLSRVGENKHDYQSMQDFANESIKMRERLIKEGKQPGKDFVDYGVFEHMKKPGDLFE